MPKRKMSEEKSVKKSERKVRFESEAVTTQNSYPKIFEFDSNDPNRSSRVK